MTCTNERQSQSRRTGQTMGVFGFLCWAGVSPILVVSVVLWGLSPLTEKLAAQESKSFGRAANKGSRLGDEETVQRWQIGVKIHAVGTCAGIYATAPVPTNWPEQQVEIVDEDLSPEVRDIRYRVLDNGVKQMVISIPRLAAGRTAHALVTVEVRRKQVLAPESGLDFVMPEKLPRDVKKFLAASPFIETRNAKIRVLAKELMREVPESTNAWERVELIYDWVRDNIKYENGKLKGAAAALKDGTGDCEELTSLFIALCRLNDIPARTVWVPGHCYPEFYLQDEYGNGYWMPCQAAGTRDFGSMPDTRPVLQKGDNFDVPDLRERQRYVAEFLKTKSVKGLPPRVNFVRKTVVAPGAKPATSGFRGF
jgi:hypothetical protein